MRRIVLLLGALALLLGGCGAKESEDRAEALQRKYAALAGCSARLRVRSERNGEAADYLLDAVKEGDETRLTVLEPAELAGVTALVSEAGELALSYEGLVLDAGSAGDGISPVLAFDLLLRAAAEGWVTERSRETLQGAPALRLCFETEYRGEKVLATAFFDGEDAPLYAELEREGKIMANLEFTSFAFGDIVEQSTGESGREHEAAAETDLGGDRP